MPKSQELPVLLSVEQTAAYLGISLRATYRMIENDALPCIRSGERKIVVPRGKLLAALGESDSHNGDES